MELVDELLRRAMATTPPPAPGTSLLVAAAALGLVLLAWPAVRLLVTVCHEAGHAVVALLVGRSLRGIRLHSDTSGLTVSRGRPTGPGMVATLFAGYPAASLVGLGAAWLVGAGHASGLLWLLTAALALMLLAIRNLHGALVVLAGGTAVALASWYLPGPVLALLATGLAWLLLLAAPRPVVELLTRPRPGSDAAQLAALTRVPRLLWLLAWLALAVAALVLGQAWLLAGP